MSKENNDIKQFLSAIDAVAEQLNPPRRAEDTGAPDCTLRQLNILNALSSHGSLNMSELAATVDIPLSTATRIVNQLVKKNLLLRRVSKGDARVVEISFSKKGDDINLYISEVRNVQALAMLNKLPKQDQSAFLKQLKTLLE